MLCICIGGCCNGWCSGGGVSFPVVNVVADDAFAV